ncbi:MAG TPA: nitrous oxide reductase family maturation protein NosD [Bacillus bacterium]|nr:nitrous oxide reductase family maturation protein NosD [Bacillus sp. (in: firmicutes)]
MLRVVLLFFSIIGLVIVINPNVKAEKLTSNVERAQITVKPGSSIQEAINDADEGAIIFVEKGQYNGKLIIDKSIQLKGEEDAIIAGDGKGHVIEVKADNVTIDNFIIEKSGKNDTIAGIWVESSNNLIENNIIKEVHYGIYVHKGQQNRLVNNEITGYDGHFSARGNGVHLFYAEDTLLQGNHIQQVQDGIYFDFAKDSTLKENYVEGSRYGYHVMYAKKGLLTENVSTKNITGLMIMDAEDFQITGNTITENLDYRGHGVLIFDSDKIELINNRVTFNNTGLSLQDARDCKIEGNIFAGNYVGLDLKDKNERNTMVNNNFIGNIVQTKIFTSVEPMDLNGQGNYWDDYSGMDLDGDGIGDIPYESGKLFDKLVEEHPTLQFFFESPTIKLWSSIEKIFPSLSGDKGMDRFPYVQPVQYKADLQEAHIVQRNWLAAFIGIMMISLAVYIFYRGRVS